VKELEKEKDVRRLGKGRADSSDDVEEGARRVTPMRKARWKPGNSKEGIILDEEDELNEEDEVDQLVSSASATSPPLRGRRTPVKRRLRPRRVQTHTPPSDGDDEEEEEGEGEEGSGVNEEEKDEEGDVSVDDEAEADDDDDVAETIVVEPRKLRNGKIVGEEDTEDAIDEEEQGDEGDENEEEGDENDEEDENEEEVGDPDAEGIDVDADGETEGSDDTDEPMEDGQSFLPRLSDLTENIPLVDLTIATAKTLVRLRRDDLVRLCETRDLDVAGTKPQLAEALLQWRDRQGNGFSSPSSAGTLRPSSAVKRRANGRSQTDSGPPPILMRSDRIHLDEPRTPPISENRKEAEPELELDLESLGLEDREIPPEKLTKLEKIGSGGFKDVFIGKFKGRKIAISEFRGQLSASKLCAGILC
jgi:hypothetical protein